MEHGNDEGAGPVVLWSTDVTGTRGPQPAVPSAAAAAGAAHVVKDGEEEEGARLAVQLLELQMAGHDAYRGAGNDAGLGLQRCVADAAVDERADEHGKERRGDAEPAVPL